MRPEIGRTAELTRPLAPTSIEPTDIVPPRDKESPPMDDPPTTDDIPPDIGAKLIEGRAESMAEVPRFENVRLLAPPERYGMNPPYIPV